MKLLVAQLCPTLCDPMNCSMPGFPVDHQHPECTQTHIQQVGDAIQPSHPLLSPFPPAPNPSQHQSLFQWVDFKIKSVSSVAQSCLTLCDPMDCSLPDSSVHGILKEWSWSGFPLPYSDSNSSSALYLLHNLWQVTECLHVSVSSCVKRRKIIVSASQHSFRDLIANK